MTITEERPAELGPVLPVEAPADPPPAPAADEGPEPLRYALPPDELHAMRFEFDPGAWSIFDVMAVREFLGYKTREDFENTAKVNPEILQIGQAWLTLRALGSPHAELSAKELGRRIKASQFVAPAVPKSPTPGA